MLFLRHPHGVKPRLAGRVVLHDPVDGVAPAGKIGVLNEIYDRFPVRKVFSAAKKRGAAPQTRVTPSFSGDAVEQSRNLFLKPGAVGKRIEQPVRDIDLMIVSHSETPIPRWGPMQMHGHYG